MGGEGGRKGERMNEKKGGWEIWCEPGREGGRGGGRGRGKLVETG